MEFNVFGLVSGGKDSIYSLVLCAALGHKIVGIGNLRPSDTSKQELDSHMFQTVGHNVMEGVARCLNVPLLVKSTQGKAKQSGVAYDSVAETESDEIHDLRLLLEAARVRLPTISAVSVGAIKSHYQRNRVESICQQLSLQSLGWLWERSESRLLHDMCLDGMVCALIKVATMGLKAQHIGLTLTQVAPSLIDLVRTLQAFSCTVPHSASAQNTRYEVNVCGEGGEFETLCLDSPIYSQELQLTETEHHVYFDDPFAPVVGLNVTGWQLGQKAGERSMASAFSPDSTFSMCIVDDAGPAGAAAASSSASGGASKAIHSSAAKLQLTASSCKAGLFLVGSVSVPYGTDMLSAAEQAAFVLSAAAAECHTHGTSLADALFVYLHLSDMADFKEVNTSYTAFFPQHIPPSRSCVQCDLPAGCKVQVTIRVVPGSHAAASSGQRAVRDALHVQSLSLWAPLCIGPYCQANSVGAEVMVAGQIPLVPHTMQLSDATLRQQVALAAVHARRILVAMGADWLSCCVVVVYVRQEALAAEGVSSAEAWAMASGEIHRHCELGCETALPFGDLPSLGSTIVPQELPWELEELASCPVFDADKPASELWERGLYNETDFCKNLAIPVSLVVVTDLPRTAPVEFEPVAFKMSTADACSRFRTESSCTAAGPDGQQVGFAWSSASNDASVAHLPAHGLLRRFAIDDTQRAENSHPCASAKVVELVAPNGEAASELIVFHV